MKQKNTPEKSRCRVAILGSAGEMGSKLQEILPHKYHEVFALDTKNNDPEVIVKTLTYESPHLVILAITPENQVSQGLKMIKDWLQKRPDRFEMPTIVNINSIQTGIQKAYSEALPELATEFTPIALISLHPFHKTSDLDKSHPIKWLLTDISIIGQEGHAAKNNIRMLRSAVSKLSTDLPSSYGNPDLKIEIVDLTKGRPELHLSGPEYHDYIMSYFHALFHMIKITPGVQESDWYKTYFSHVTTSDKSSESIIKGNCFTELVYNEFQILIGPNPSLEKILEAAKELLKKAHQYIPAEHHSLKTDDLKLLEALIQ